MKTKLLLVLGLSLFFNAQAQLHFTSLMTSRGTDTARVDFTTSQPASYPITVQAYICVGSLPCYDMSRFVYLFPEWNIYQNEGSVSIDSLSPGTDYVWMIRIFDQDTSTPWLPLDFRTKSMTGLAEQNPADRFSITIEANGQIRVNGADNVFEGTMVVSNILGQKEKEITGAIAQQTISISNMSSGVHIISVLKNGQVVATKKFVL